MKYLFAVLLLTGCAIGQSPKKVIWVDYQGSDAVGTKLVFEFKEEVRKSSGYQLEMEKKVDWGETIPFGWISSQLTLPIAASVPQFQLWPPRARATFSEPASIMYA